ADRTTAMYKASAEIDGAMAAVNGLSVANIQSILDEFPTVYAVNYNSPQQTVISGLRSDLTEAAAQLKSAGGKVIILNVKGAFHTPYMASAGQALTEVLAQTITGTAKYPVLSNIDATVYPQTSQEIKARIIQQVTSPVRFTDMIENLYESGVRIFIETGYGRTLQGLVQRILPQADILTGGVSDRTSLAKMIEKMKETSNV
ncbi:MAG: acyltransferase domain-containing protein, partial [Clostridiaceae bacterium]